MTKGPSLRARLIIYPLLAIIFGAASFFITMSALGYNIYFKDGKIQKERTGTIILATRPYDSTVYLDDELQKSRTPAFPFMTLQIKKLKAGEHKIKIEKSGYVTWEGKFKVYPGMVAWGNQILLIPLEKKAEPYNFATPVKSSLRSPDRTRILLKLSDEKNKLVSFWEVNLESKERLKIFDRNLADGEDLNAVSYSFNNSRILVERNLATVKSVLVFETKENPSSWDVSDIFKLSFEKYLFNPKNQNEIFFIREGNLYSLNYIEKTMSAVLDSNVSDMFVDSGELLYVKKENENNNLLRFQSPGNPQKIIEKLPKSEKYSIRFLGDERGYSVLADSTKSLYLYKNPHDPFSEPKIIAENVLWQLPSPKFQYLGYFANNSFVSYEIEKDRFFTTLSDTSFDTIDWLPDQFNLIYSKDGKMNFVTFAGFYNTELFDVKDNFPVYSDVNSPQIYFFSNNKETSILDLFVYNFNL